MVEVMNVSVKKFKNLCRKKNAEIQVLQLIPKMSSEPVKQSRIHDCSNTQLRNVLLKYKNVFQDSVLNGLPPQRSVDMKLKWRKN